MDALAGAEPGLFSSSKAMEAPTGEWRKRPSSSSTICPIAFGIGHRSSVERQEHARSRAIWWLNQEKDSGFIHRIPLLLFSFLVVLSHSFVLALLDVTVSSCMKSCIQGTRHLISREAANVPSHSLVASPACAAFLEIADCQIARWGEVSMAESWANWENFQGLFLPFQAIGC